MVELAGTAALGSVLFPELGPVAGDADPVAMTSPVQSAREEGEEMVRQAYRDGYAAGYSSSWAEQRRRSAPVLRVLRRLASDVREKTVSAWQNVELRRDDIAIVIAASLVAEEVAAVGEDS